MKLGDLTPSTQWPIKVQIQRSRRKKGENLTRTEIHFFGSDLRTYNFLVYFFLRTPSVVGSSRVVDWCQCTRSDPLGSWVDGWGPYCSLLFSDTIWWFKTPSNNTSFIIQESITIDNYNTNHDHSLSRSIDRVVIRWLKKRESGLIDLLSSQCTRSLVTNNVYTD